MRGVAPADSQPSLATAAAGPKRARERLLAIKPREVSFDVRGFHVSTPAARDRLEQHGLAFVDGFNLALASADGEELAERALGVPLEERGFAYEGAAMALALLDLLTLAYGRRLDAFLRGSGAPHVYMVHVGVGWALARLRLRPWGRLHGLDPLLRWLALDGYGFHEGFFHPERSVRRAERPRKLFGYAERGFDQGLGRSLWFVDCADVERVASTIGGFPEQRRPDLWSGAGLAATYAGAVGRSELERLAELAGPHLAHVAQGAAFAATARLHAGNPVPETELGCEVLCGIDGEGAAEVVGDALRGLERDVDGAAYERWRARIRAALVAGGDRE